MSKPLSANVAKTCRPQKGGSEMGWKSEWLTDAELAELRKEDELTNMMIDTWREKSDEIIRLRAAVVRLEDELAEVRAELAALRAERKG